MAIPNEAAAQTNNTFQFWNEFAFSHPLPKAWSTEFNIGNSWTGEQENKSPFANFAQWYLRGWMHYYPTARWKVSLFIAYYENISVDDTLNQKNNEWRWALQGAYYFNKLGYTLNSRTRIESRNIMDDEGIRENVIRFRQQMRFLYPFGAKLIRAKVFYAIASDEVFFKTKSNITGNQFFDRNRFTLGGGYAFADNIQAELTYVNEFKPGTTYNDMYHAIQLNFTFNNFISNIKHRRNEPQAQTVTKSAEDDE